MLAIEVYKSFLLKINKNDTNSDIDISKGEFVLLFNTIKDRWLRDQIRRYESNADVEEISELQVKQASLPIEKEDVDSFTTFVLPENFFRYISSYSFCSNSTCAGVIVRHYLFKPRNENMLLENSNTEPSLEFEETVVDLSNHLLFVYKKDFSVDRTFLNYYRRVGNIDIAGYRKLDGTASEDKHPDISDFLVDEILNRCAEEVIRRYENPEGFQLAKDRTQTED